MKVIDGEWRPCTPGERAALGMILFRCVKHSPLLGCECRLPDCVRVMERLQEPKVGAFRVTDIRRPRW
jgi:hypothetical protein